MTGVVHDWKSSVHGDDAELFSLFSQRVAKFVEFRDELARRGTEVSPAAGREWGDNDANRSVRKALNTDLEKLTELYSDRAKRVYADLDSAIDSTALWMSVLAALAVMLAAAGAIVINRSVARPLATITGVTEKIAAGETGVSIPYGDRNDEIGALSRSIGVFKNAMRHNEELNRTVIDDATTRTQRQEQMSG